MFPFPPVNNIQPTWTGHGFQLGNANAPVLSYGDNQSGWSDDLTLLHEDNAGTTHFIDLASRAHALSEMRNGLPSTSQSVIMDIGCSSGFMLREYRDNLPGVLIMGSDVVRGPLERLAREIPDIPLLHFDLVQCPLPDASLDGISMLNVFEHIQDDLSALKQVYRILKPGGVAVIEVPSGPDLFDSYDRTLMHYRRYNLRDLVKMARLTGFQVVKQSHLGVFLYPGFWLVKKKNRLLDALRPEHSIEERARKDEAVISQEIRTTGGNPLFRWLMNQELHLGEHISYPFGIRCLLTLKK